MSDNNDILDRATAQVHDKRRRQELREELCAHLDDAAAYYASRGMPEAEARLAAQEEIGDVDDVAYKLGELYSFFPAKDMKNAINLFIAGFVLSSVLVNVWYLAVFIGAAAAVCMLFALYRMRSCSRFLKAAYIIFVIVFVLSTLFSAVSALPLYPSVPAVPEVLRYAWELVNPTVFMLSLLAFAKLMSDKYADDIKAAAAFYFITHVIVILTGVGVLLFAVAVIFAVLKLAAARNYLWANELDAGIVELAPKKRRTLIVIPLLIAFLPYCTALATTYTPPASELYSRGETSPRAEAVAQELKSQGVSENLLADMRYEDIERLDGAKLCGQSELYASSFNHKLGAMCFTQYLFDTPDGNFMALIYFDVPCEGTMPMQLIFSQQSPDVRMDTNGSEYAPVCLYDKNGRTLRQSVHHEIMQHAAGLEFKLLRGAYNQRGYFMVPMHVTWEHPGQKASDACYGFEPTLSVFVPKNAFRLPFCYDNLKCRGADDTWTVNGNIVVPGVNSAEWNNWDEIAVFPLMMKAVEYEEQS